MNETSSNQMFHENKGSNPRNAGNETSNMNSAYRNNIHTSTVTTVVNYATSVQNETTITEGKHEEDFDKNINDNHHTNNNNNINNTSIDKHWEKEQNEKMENEDNMTTLHCMKNYDGHDPNNAEFDAAMALSTNVDHGDNREENEQEEENEIQILKENVQDIFDQLTNLELLVQSLHEKIDVIADHVL